MRFELKDFQDDAVALLLKFLDRARAEVVEGDLQAIILSSPTGSGKTAIVTALMERLLRGREGRPPLPDATFLWLSDSPELNEQSRMKIVTTSEVFQSRVETVDRSFNAEVFQAGRIYFLNTQKLRDDAKLVSKGGGDKRNWTIWETIQNTADRRPGSFIVILDEAHRGMRESRSAAAETRAETARLTIVQRFLTGDPEVSLKPVPIILGMSATPDRFRAVLQAVRGSKRTLRECDVDPEDVRESGLIKDRIILDVAEDGESSDWTLLQSATKRFASFTKDWAAFCLKNAITPPVQPILVVQVEDVGEGAPTRTNLDLAIDVIQRVLESLPDGSLVHCFQGIGDLEHRGHVIRYVEPPLIQGNTAIRVVFFKTALSTGWDCPRAEVMMSFRRAVDETSIAQLVGRMVRTPLARRVSDDALNSVMLALPYYDEKAVKAIVKRLESADSGGAKAELAEDLAIFGRATDKSECFAVLTELQTFRLGRRRRVAETVRAVRLARWLDMDGLTQGAQTKVKDQFVEVIKAESRRLSEDPTFTERVSGKERIRVQRFVLEYGRPAEDIEPELVWEEVTPENIEDMFTRCGSILGEGIHLHYWRKAHDTDRPYLAKLQLFCILADQSALNAIQNEAERAFERLYAGNREQIDGLPDVRREEYRAIRRKGAAPVPEGMTMPSTLEVRRESPNWSGHLYVDAKGKFGFKANGWEEPILRSAQAAPGFLGWLRNYPRKDWSLCIPYGATDEKGFYPDLLVFRRVGKEVLVDIYDPHNDQYSDAPAKAAALAKYADRFGDHLGEVQVIRKRGTLQRLRLNDPVVRSRVIELRDEVTLNQLFEQYAQT